MRVKKIVQFVPLSTLLLFLVGCSLPGSTTSNSTAATTTTQNQTSTTSIAAKQAETAAYTSNELQIAFTYPKQFSDDEQCSPEMNDDTLWFLAGQVEIRRTKTNDTLTQASRKETAGFASDDFIEKNIFIGAAPAKRIDWHSIGGTNDFGTIVLVKYGAYAYKLTINGKPTWPCLTDYSDKQIDMLFTNLYNSLTFTQE